MAQQPKEEYAKIYEVEAIVNDRVRQHEADKEGVFITRSDHRIDMMEIKSSIDSGFKDNRAQTDIIRGEIADQSKRISALEKSRDERSKDMKKVLFIALGVIIPIILSWLAQILNTSKVVVP